MVEVAPGKKEPLKIPVWKYILFLVLMGIISLIMAWYALSSNFGAQNSFLEKLRKYFAFAASYRPNIKAEDNFESALKIHGIEELGENRFALFITATDKKGNPLTSINPGEITLKLTTDKGKTVKAVIDRCKPLHMKTEWKKPLSLASVMDYSGSMFPSDIKASEENYSELINNIAFPFSTTVIKFNDRVNEMIGLSEVKADVIKAIKKQVPLQNTAMFDGIDKGIEKIQTQPHVRFIILSTDGNDNASVATLNDVLRRAKLHNVSIFILGFGWLDVQSLRTISENTQGYYSYVPDSSKLKDWFQKLGNIINNVQVVEIATKNNKEIPQKIDIKINTKGLTIKGKREF